MEKAKKDVGALETAETSPETETLAQKDQTVQDLTSQPIKKEPKRKKTKAELTMFIISIVLLCLMTPILLANIVLIISAAVHPDKIPQIFGIKPVVVLSDSMSPMIHKDDLIFVKTTDATKLNVGDVITFRDEDGTVITHKIKEVGTDTSGNVVYQTYGIFNYLKDESGNPDPNYDHLIYEPDQGSNRDTWVHAENVEGLYAGKVPGLGGFILWMQGTVGIIVCIGIPLLSFIIYELVRRNADLKLAQTSNENANNELEELRKKLAELEGEKDKNS